MKIYLFFISFIVLSSCAQKESENEKKIFRYNESSDITSLDPAYARNLEEMWVVNQIFDGLVEIGNDMRIQPLLAESWEVSDSLKTYTFYLRKDIYFHKNELFKSEDSTRLVTAHDVVYSWNRILDPEVASPGKWVFNNVDIDRNGGFFCT